MFWLVQYKYRGAREWHTTAIEIEDSRSATALDVAKEYDHRFSGERDRIRVAPANNPPHWEAFSRETTLVSSRTKRAATL